MSAPSAFGTFRVLHQIGSGVLGPVFRSYDSQRDRLVAIKAFKLELVPEAAARLADACRGLIAVPPAHPAIVAVVDAGVEGSTPYLALEYASGDALDVFLRQSGAIAPARALAMLRPLAEATDASWEQGVGHGALHPRDVFTTGIASELRVTGFGIAQALERVGVKAPLRRPYAAPERIGGEEWDQRADVYALAVIAHEMLTGRRPSAASDGDSPAASEAASRSATGESWRAVIAEGMAERPDDRFETAVALVDAIAAIAGTAPPAETAPVSLRAEAVPQAAPKRQSRPRRPRASRVETPLLPGVDLADDVNQLPDEAAPVPADPPVPSSPDMERAAPRSEPELQPEQDAEPESQPEPAPQPEPEAQPAPQPAPELEPQPEPESELVAEAATDAEPQHQPIALVDEPSSVRAQDLRLFAEDVPTPGERLERSSPISIDLPAQTDGSPDVAPSVLEVPSAGFPWAATAAVAFAGLVLGAVIGYQIGFGRGRDAVIAEVVGSAAKSAPAPDTTSAQPPANPQTPTQPAVTPDPVPAPAAVAVAAGRLVIQSEPSGAIAYVDGRRVGSTPVTVRDVALGAHEVRVTRSGYAPATERVTLSASAASRAVRLRLRRGSSGATAPAPAFGSIEVDSRPRGAQVTIDGRRVGQTPVRVPELSPGDHKVLIELTGHRPVSSTVKVVAGEQTRLAVTLEQVGSGPQEQSASLRERR